MVNGWKAVKLEKLTDVGPVDIEIISTKCYLFKETRQWTSPFLSKYEYMKSFTYINLWVDNLQRSP